MSSRLTLRLTGTVALALTAACVEDVDPDAMAMQPSGGSAGMTSTGSAGSGVGAGTGNNMGGAGGGGGIMADPEFGMGTRCPAVTQALLTDFTPPAPAAVADAGADAAPPAVAPATGASFGDYATTFSGATFVYPGEGTMYPVTSDVSGGNWHMTGALGDYSGFGIVFQIIVGGVATGCLVDASAYTGISFTMSGSVPMGNTITLNVGTQADDVSHLWLNANTNPATPVAPNGGRCIPAMTQYDGTCGSPNFPIPVTAEPTTVSVTWSQLAGGRPASMVNPSEITGLSWNFPAPAGAGTATPTTYPIDITIDDLRFTGGP